MLFKILADAVVIAHFLWIVFLIFGTIAGRRYRSIKYIHISGLIFAITLQAFDWYCPLTHLEVWLRAHHGMGRVYTGSYITHYLGKIIYIELDRWIIVILTVVLGGINALIYCKAERHDSSDMVS